MQEILHQLISSLSVYPIVFRSVFKSQVVHDSSINSITITSLPAMESETSPTTWEKHINPKLLCTEIRKTLPQISCPNRLLQDFSPFANTHKHTLGVIWKNRLSKTAKPFQKSPSDRSPMGCSSNVERRPSTTSIHVQPFNTRITKWWMPRCNSCGFRSSAATETSLLQKSWMKKSPSKAYNL